MNKKHDSINNNKHLPIYGPGPFIGGFMIILTLIAVFLEKNDLIPKGQINGSVKTTMTIIGAVLVVGGIALWIYAVPVSKIDDGILHNRLVTTGAYAHVRNPIYSAIMIACDGILLMTGNIYFLVLPLIFWVFMSIVLMHTEEVWLRKMFKQEYEEYCQSVNRCWPSLKRYRKKRS